MNRRLRPLPEGRPRKKDENRWLSVVSANAPYGKAHGIAVLGRYVQGYETTPFGLAAPDWVKFLESAN
jgi:hypothetical protein